MRFKGKLKGKLQEKIKFKPFVPNFITIISLCLGLTSIRLSFEGSFEKSVICILIAGVMDFLDGKTARLLKVKSKLGGYLDSLTDMVSFGVAPMFLVYYFSLFAHKKIGWTACLYYAICMVLRLARFNLTIDVEDQQNKFFVGVPAPMGALIITTPLLFFLETECTLFSHFMVNFILVWITGFLMISTLPVFALKHIDFSKSHTRLWVVILGSFLPFFYTHFYLMLGLCGVLSIASIPISFNYYSKKSII